MSPWDGAARWINTLLLVIVGFVGFDTLFRLLEANERNVIVGFARSVSTVLLAPFVGMFDEQEFLLTALIAVLGYALVAGVVMAAIRSAQASRRRRIRRAGAPAEPPAGERIGPQPHEPTADGGRALYGGTASEDARRGRPQGEEGDRRVRSDVTEPRPNGSHPAETGQRGRPGAWGSPDS